MLEFELIQWTVVIPDDMLRLGKRKDRAIWGCFCDGLEELVRELTAEYFQEAKVILQAAGAQVTMSVDLKGTYRFATLFDNWEAYGRFAQSLPTNQSWGALLNKVAGNPSANQTDNLLLFQNAVATNPMTGPGTVTQVTVWEPTTTGTMAQLVEGAMGAKPIHERAGASVSVFTGGGRMYYLMRFENFAAWGKNRDTPNPEFQAYFQSLDTDGAIIVDQITSVAF